MAKYKTHRFGTPNKTKSTFQLILHFLRDCLCTFVYLGLSKYVLAVNSVLFLILAPYCALLLSFCALVSCFAISKHMIKVAYAHLSTNAVTYTCAHAASFSICLFYLLFSSHTLHQVPRLVSYFLESFLDVLLTLRLNYNCIAICALSTRYLPMHVNLCTCLSSHFLKGGISFELLFFFNFKFLLLTSCIATLHFVFGTYVGIFLGCIILFFMSYIVRVLTTLSFRILPGLKMCVICLKALTVWIFWPVLISKILYILAGSCPLASTWNALLVSMTASYCFIYFERQLTFCNVTHIHKLITATHFMNLAVVILFHRSILASVSLPCVCGFFYQSLVQQCAFSNISCASFPCPFLHCQLNYFSN